MQVVVVISPAAGAWKYRNGYSGCVGTYCRESADPPRCCRNLSGVGVDRICPMWLHAAVCVDCGDEDDEEEEDDVEDPRAPRGKAALSRRQGTGRIDKAGFRRGMRSFADGNTGGGGMASVLNRKRAAAGGGDGGDPYEVGGGVGLDDASDFAGILNGAAVGGKKKIQAIHGILMEGDDDDDGDGGDIGVCRAAGALDPSMFAALANNETNNNIRKGRRRQLADTWLTIRGAGVDARQYACMFWRGPQEGGKWEEVWTLATQLNLRFKPAEKQDRKLKAGGRYLMRFPYSDDEGEGASGLWNMLWHVARMGDVEVGKTMLQWGHPGDGAASDWLIAQGQKVAHFDSKTRLRSGRGNSGWGGWRGAEREGWKPWGRGGGKGKNQEGGGQGGKGQ